MKRWVGDRPKVSLRHLSNPLHVGVKTKESALVLKPSADVSSSPKQEYRKGPVSYKFLFSKRRGCMGIEYAQSNMLNFDISAEITNLSLHLNSYSASIVPKSSLHQYHTLEFSDFWSFIKYIFTYSAVCDSVRSEWFSQVSNIPLMAYSHCTGQVQRIGNSLFPIVLSSSL